MLPAAMSTSTTISEEGSFSSGTRADENESLKPLFSSMSSYLTQPPALKPKKKRNKPGNPDPEAEVVSLSPRTLMSTNRYACEVCGKGFQREQNLQLHRRGHNLPWRLKQIDGGGGPRKKVYVCPEETCVHHDAARALGDLTGIKKHFWRKHGEKKWTCERCPKKYAVMSDWKAHVRTCGTREYRCDCGTVFSRKDSFATHRAFCDALAQESARVTAAATAAAAAAAAAIAINTSEVTAYTPMQEQNPTDRQQLKFSSWEPLQYPKPNPISTLLHARTEDPPLVDYNNFSSTSILASTQHPFGTAILPKSATASQLGSSRISTRCTATFGTGVAGFGVGDIPSRQKGDCLLTRDFLGMASEGDEDLVSITNSGGFYGGLHFMASPAAGLCDCSAHAAAVTTATKPDSTEGFGFHHLPSAGTAASQAWWRLLE